MRRFHHDFAEPLVAAGAGKKLAKNLKASERRAMRVALALLALGFAAAAPGATDSCNATIADVQAVRDQLEIARAHFKASKDNFGPGRGKAIAAAAAAIDALQQAAGHTIAPTPDSRIAEPVGRHNHPHMHHAQAALAEAHRALDRAACLLPGPTEAVRHNIEAAERAVDEAFTFNPMGSGK
jgi:hypothetical protein